MTIIKACIFILAAVGLLSPAYSQMPTGHPPDPNSDLEPTGLVASQQVLTVFFTGDELGQLQPCGCSGGQLGGLDRRNAVLSSVEQPSRLIIDTGSLVAQSSQQNLIKFNIIIQSFNQLGYDVINLTDLDISIARQEGLLEGLGVMFHCITAESIQDNLPAKFTKRFTINGKPVDLTVAVARTQEQINRLAGLFPAPDANSGVPVNILIAKQAEPNAVAEISNLNLVDCLIIASQFDEPTLISDPNARPLVISQGRLGKYVGKIQVTLPLSSGKPRLSFSSVAVTEDLPQHQPLVELYKDYQRLVREANLLEEYPRFVLPENLEYVGSSSCKLCHDYEYEKWLTSTQVFIPGLSRQAAPDSSHANAYATLEQVNSHYDPECVICHVIGMQYYTGFVDPNKTPEMKDVGCENCHGPGSEHIRSLGAAETTGPMSTCTDCHTAEHSAEYAGHKEQYFEKTIHWRQPLSRTRVTEPNVHPDNLLSR